MRRPDRVNVSSVVDQEELRAWVGMHERECDAFQRYLQKLDPRTWREEFDRILADTVAASDRN